MNAVKHLYIFITILFIAFNGYSQSYSSIEELLKAQYYDEFKEYFEASGLTRNDLNIALELFTLVQKPQRLIPLAKQLSDKGYSIGDFWLGWCYEGGEGVPMDYNEAFRYFHKAVTNRTPFPYAMEKIGSYYYSGVGVNKNDDEAYKWFEKGAQIIKHKDYRAVCMYRMAYIHLNKQSVSKSDIESAYHLYSQVAELANEYNGEDFNHKAYGSLVPYMHKHSAYMAAMLILAEGAQGGDEAKGIRWLEKSAILGDEEGQFAFGIHLLSINKKDPKGIEWIKKSAAQGYSDAIIFLNEYK